MEFTRQNMISVDNILSDVLMYFEDSDYFLFTKGWYISQIQQALQEISIDTLFQTQTTDISIQNRLIIPIPEGAYNLRELYIFNETDCKIQDLKNVYWKRRYQTNGDEKGYTAENSSQNTTDPFFSNYSYFPHAGEDDIYFFNTINGDIHLSQSCSDYDKLRVVFNGLITALGETPTIPVIFREAVKQWVIVNCLKVLRVRDRKQWGAIYQEEYQTLLTPYDGSWDKAKYRAQCLGTKKLRDFKEYLSSINS